MMRTVVLALLMAVPGFAQDVARMDQVVQSFVPGIDHGGGIEGFNTLLAYYPETKVTVVVLGNLNGTAPQEIAGKLGPVAHGESVQLPSERKEITVPSETLRKYVGTYELTPRINVMITLDGGQLMEQLSGQAKYPIFAESETQFS